jgi:hypothetical protein
MFHVKRCGGLVARAAEWPRQEGRKGAGTGGPGGDRSGADSQSRAGGFTCNGSPRPKPDSRQASSDGLRRPRGRAAKPGGFPRRVSRDARSAPLDRLDCWVDADRCQAGRLCHVEYLPQPYVETSAKASIAVPERAAARLFDAI